MRRVLPVLLFVAGCSQSPDSIDDGPVAAVGASAADFRGNEGQSAAAYLQTPEFAAADLMRGELLSLACQACHTLAADEGPLLGPNLHGVFGRLAAAADEFEYSPALRAAGIVWTPRALDAWLADPSEFLPGNNMAFTGYNLASDRHDLIAFLLHKTSADAE